MKNQIDENIITQIQEQIKQKYNSKSTEIIAEQRKSYSLRITPKLEIKIKIPHSTSKRELENFLYKKNNWLQKQINYFETLYELESPQKQNKEQDNYIYYLGQKLRIKIITIRQKKEFIQIINDNCIIHTNNHDNINKILDNWLKKTAKEYMLDLLKKQWNIFSKHNQYKGHEPTYKIKSLKRCWGNCRPSLITLNYNLIFVPTECIEYVIMHELCHLIYLDHSKAFYELLEYNLPNWKKYNEILKTFGYRLKIINCSL